MGIKRRRRETAIAEGKKPPRTRGSSGSRTSQTGGAKFLPEFLNDLFLRVSRQNFSIFSQKNFIISQKFLMTFFFFFFLSPPFFFFFFLVTDLFLCFNLLLVCQCYNSNKILGG